MPLHLVERTKLIRHYTWRQPPGPAVRAQDAVYLGPILVGTLAAIALISPPQAREVYLATFAPSPDQPLTISWQAMWSLFGVLMLSATLFAWNARLVDSLRDDRFHTLPSLVVDRGLRDFRTLKALCASALPILGLIIGMQLAVPDILIAADHVSDADPALLNSLKGAEKKIHYASAVCFLAGAMLLMTMLTDRFARWTSFVLKSSWFVLGLVLFLPFYLQPETTVSLAQGLGPIGTLSLVLIAVIPALRLVGGVLYWIARYPLAIAITIIARTLGIWLPASLALIVGTVALVSYARRDYEKPVKEPRTTAVVPSRATKELLPHEQVFVEWLATNRQSWLERRGLDSQSFSKLPPDQRPRYPVFIVAAQGGGIYAAASTMALLTRLQDHCSALHEHIFAISAVSGGALGSAIYRGLAAEVRETGPCSASPGGAMFRRVQSIATADHLSALLLSAPIDWLSKLPPLIARMLGGGNDAGSNANWLQRAGEAIVESELNRRSETLAKSFSETFARHASGGTAAALSIDVDAYWQKGRSRTPALLLASTSVETGHRIVHSPFSLSRVGDGTLQSFADLEHQLRLQDKSLAKIRRQSIIEAAVTSARFPGVLPAWPLWHHVRDERAEIDDDKRKQNNPEAAVYRLNRLNFVDGGYADSSGTTTAADVVRRLQRFINEPARHEGLAAGVRELLARVELHVIILTDTEITKGLQTANGTNFPDTWAPVEALFNARRLAASTALASARRDMREALQHEALQQTCDDQATGYDPTCSIHTITLDHEIFTLPLGWLLSETSNKVMLAMLGSPDRWDERSCTQQAAPVAGRKDTRFDQVARRNGCTQRRIIDILSR